MGHRGLSIPFFEDLRSGILTPLIERVLKDHSLCLEIRDDYINIYYRGGNLLRVSRASTGGHEYLANFDENFAGKSKEELLEILPSSILAAPEHAVNWTQVFPCLKQTMDLYLGEHPKEERESQQVIVRDNNFGSMCPATDFYICDIEYACKVPCGPGIQSMGQNGRKESLVRFDMIGVGWPSSSKDRKRAYRHRLAFIEVKFGDGAMAGKASIGKHVDDVSEFISDKKRLQGFKEEMVGVFNQKRELGLIKCKKNLESFSEEAPMLILLVINHDPASQALRLELDSLKLSTSLDVHIASGSFMGYGLFNEANLPILEARTRYPELF
jgi:hypothetical protein